MCQMATRCASTSAAMTRVVAAPMSWPASKRRRRSTCSAITPPTGRSSSGSEPRTVIKPTPSAEPVSAAISHPCASACSRSPAYDVVMPSHNRRKAARRRGAGRIGNRRALSMLRRSLSRLLDAPLEACKEAPGLVRPIQQEARQRAPVLYDLRDRAPYLLLEPGLHMLVH